MTVQAVGIGDGVGPGRPKRLRSEPLTDPLLVRGDVGSPKYTPGRRRQVDPALLRKLSDRETQ